MDTEKASDKKKKRENRHEREKNKTSQNILEK